MEREIIVRGSGQARSMPDRAVITVVVDADAATREQAYREAAGLAARVDAVLSGRASALGRVVTATLVVHPRTRWKKGESVRTGWRASRGTTVEVTDFAELGELIAELAAAGGAVSGPSWRLDESNQAHREARRLAAEDARQRAEDYAAALGLTIDNVAWVSEPGLRTPGDDTPRFASAAPMAARAGGAARDVEEVIDVTPDEMTVAAAVEVGFHLRANDS